MATQKDNMTEEKLELIVRGDIRKLHLKPNDKVIVTVKDYLTSDTMKQMRKQLEQLFPKNQVVFMVGGARINVVSGDE